MRPHSKKYVIPERLVPSQLDFTDPTQKEEYDCHANKYRFAAMFTEGKKVLDLACGAGYGSAILADEGKSHSVTGVDIDAKTIEHAKCEYQAGSITFINAAYHEIDTGMKYDVVVSINILEYVDDPWSFIVKIKQLLADAGELIISVHTTPTTDFNPHTHHDISRRRLIRMLKKAGFRIENVFWQIKYFGPRNAVDLMKRKKGGADQSLAPRSIIRFYMRHPLKALRRIRSILADGFTVKTLTVRARLI